MMNQTTNEIINCHYKKGDYTMIDGKRWKVDEVKKVDEYTYNITWSRDVTKERFYDNNND